MVKEGEVNQYKLSATCFYKVIYTALAGVAQWIEHRPENQRVTGLIPSQGPCLGCRARSGLQWGVCERQPHIDVFLPLFVSFLSPLSKINKIFF